jgi:Uma2 family endonuclease
MTPTFDRKRMKMIYDWAADRYLRSLPLEHFMEATAQATQRKITLESFDLIHARRPDVQCFNELLVQYPKPGADLDHPGQVVPDNMVVIHPEPIVADTNYATLLQPVGPFLVLEYVSKHSVRKDYEINYTKYEQELRVPYYLVFYPDAEELSLFHLRDGKYHAVLPNAAGRLAIPELELEAALLGGWVRFWFRGELLPLPAELLVELDAARRQRDEAARQRDEAARQRDEAARQRDEAARQRDEAARQRDEERAAREEAERRAEAERAERLALQAELARLREQLGRTADPGG